MAETNRLASRVGRLELLGPCLVASSVLTGDLERIRLAERFGAAGVSTKMAMLHDPPQSQPAVILRGGGPGGLRGRGLEGIVTPGDRRLTLDEACVLVDQVKQHTDIVVIANLLAPADDLDGWARLARTLEGAGADALELDISCPNLPRDADVASRIPPGNCVAQYPELSESVTRAVRESTCLPVLCKLTAQVADVVEVARACRRGGADGLVAINGLRAAPPLDIRSGGRARYATIDRHNLGTLTGPPLFPVACGVVAQIARAVDLPVIGCGGVSSWQDVVEMMMWGASAVQVCTAVLTSGFQVVEALNAGVDTFLEEQGYGSVQEIVGLALRYVVAPSEVRYGSLRLAVDPELCNVCGLCLSPGICLAISEQDGRIVLDNDACVECGLCLQICPRGAIAEVHEVGAAPLPVVE